MPEGNSLADKLNSYAGEIENNPQAVTPDSQKSPTSLSEKLNSYASEISGDGLIGGTSDIDVSDYEELDHVFAGENLDYDRAMAQSGTQQALNAVGQAITKGGLGVAEYGGYLLDVPEWLGTSGEGMDAIDGAYTNWLSEFAKKGKESMGEAMPIYRTDPGETFDFGDSGWWFEQVEGLLQSGVEFGVTGAIVGGTLGAASKTLAQLAKTNAKIAQMTKTGTSAFAMNYVESKMMSTEVFNTTYNNGLKYGLSHEESSKIAAEEANDFMRINKLNTLTEFVAMSSLLRPNYFGTGSEVKGLLSKSGVIAKDAIGESLEEVSGGFFQKEGERSGLQEIGKKTGLDLKIEGENTSYLNRFFDYASSGEGIQEAVAGAFGGPVQTVLGRGSKAAIDATVAKKWTKLSDAWYRNEETGKVEPAPKVEKEIDAMYKSGEYANKILDTVEKSAEYSKQKADALANKDMELAAQIEKEEFDGILLQALNHDRGGYIINELDSILNSKDSTEEQKEKATEFKRHAQERMAAYDKLVNKEDRNVANSTFIIDSRIKALKDTKQTYDNQILIKQEELLSAVADTYPDKEVSPSALQVHALNTEIAKDKDVIAQLEKKGGESAELAIKAVQSRIDSKTKELSTLLEDEKATLDASIRSTPEFQELETLYQKREDVASSIAGHTLSRNKLTESGRKQIQKDQLNQAVTAVDKASTEEQLNSIISYIDTPGSTLLNDKEIAEIKKNAENKIKEISLKEDIRKKEQEAKESSIENLLEKNKQINSEIAELTGTGNIKEYSDSIRDYINESGQREIDDVYKKELEAFEQASVPVKKKELESVKEEVEVKSQAKKEEVKKTIAPEVITKPSIYYKPLKRNAVQKNIVVGEDIQSVQAIELNPIDDIDFFAAKRNDGGYDIFESDTGAKALSTDEKSQKNLNNILSDFLSETPNWKETIVNTDSPLRQMKSEISELENEIDNSVTEEDVIAEELSSKIETLNEVERLENLGIAEADAITDTTEVPTTEYDSEVLAENEIVYPGKDVGNTDRVYSIQYIAEDKNTFSFTNYIENPNIVKEGVEVEFVAAKFEDGNITEVFGKDIDDNADVKIKLYNRFQSEMEGEETYVKDVTGNGGEVWAWLDKKDSLSHPFRKEIVKRLQNGERVFDKIDYVTQGLKFTENNKTHTNPKDILGFQDRLLIAREGGYTDGATSETIVTDLNTPSPRLKGYVFGEFMMADGVTLAPVALAMRKVNESEVDLITNLVKDLFLSTTNNQINHGSTVSYEGNTENISYLNALQLLVNYGSKTIPDSEKSARGAKRKFYVDSANQTFYYGDNVLPMSKGKKEVWEANEPAIREFISSLPRTINAKYINTTFGDGGINDDFTFNGEKVSRSMSYNSWAIDGDKQDITFFPKDVKYDNVDNYSDTVEPINKKGKAVIFQRPFVIMKGDLVVEKKEVSKETTIKPDVFEIFESNTELNKIGTPEQYSQYLDTVFPNSKVKDIVYHGTPYKFDNFISTLRGVNTGKSTTNEKFDSELATFFTDNEYTAHSYSLIGTQEKRLAIASGLFKLSTSKSLQKDYDIFKEEFPEIVPKLKALQEKGLKTRHSIESLQRSYSKMMYLDIINMTQYLKTKKDISVEDRQTIQNEIENLVKEGGFVDNTKRVILNIQNPIIKDFNGQPFVDQPDGTLGARTELTKLINKAIENSNDAVIANNIKDPGKGTNYAILDTKNAHILGSKKDIEGFKEFVGNKTDQEQSVDEAISIIQSRYPDIKIGFTENGESFEVGDGKVVLNQEELNQVGYSLKAVNLLQSNKAEQVFTKGKKAGWDLNKILTELQIPKEQKQIILNHEFKSGYYSDASLRENIIMALLTENSFVVEINTASKIDTGFSTEDNQFEPDYDEDGNMIIPKITFKPTQYYSDLTVPGGTNYIENEISTPAITPSIKGHAQFSTDNGIGWFRSDERSIQKILTLIEAEQEELEYMKSVGVSEEQYLENKRKADAIRKVEPSSTVRILPTKTRRILEVQSDLFQKGRDKKNLTRAGEISYQQQKEWIKEGLTIEQMNERQSQMPSNQFLQLLNQKNNWVTFFTKSIIQDSAKKGYEKVLFPKGDTAAKIEGHHTLEEFKRTKETRIKILEDALAGNIGGLPYDEAVEIYGADFSKDGDIRINNEIKQLKQELADVESGNTQLSSIAKFYEDTITNILIKQGYNPVEITDEYGNKWNEVDLSQEKTKQEILLQQDKKGNIKGQANIEAMTVLFDKDRATTDTIYHEYAHHYIAWNRNSPIVQEAIKKWGTEEALVQAIGEQSVKQKGEAWSWFKDFINWLKSKINKLSDKDAEELKNILTDAFLDRKANTALGLVDSKQSVIKAPPKSSLIDSAYAKTNKASEDINTDDLGIPDFSIMNDGKAYPKYTEKQLVKEIANVKEQLGDLPIETINTLLNTPDGELAEGKFEKDLITVSTLGRYGTVYHEAFHAVSKAIIKEDERMKVYDLQSKRLGIERENIKAIEESLADEYREFMLKRGALNIPSWIRPFYNAILKVANLFRNDKKKLFYNIRAGKYKNVPRVVTEDALYSKLYDSLSSTVIADGREMMTYLLFKYTGGLSNTPSEKIKLKEALDEIKEWVEYYKDSPDKTDDQRYTYGKIADHFEDFSKLTINHMRQYGYREEFDMTGEVIQEQSYLERSSKDNATSSAKMMVQLNAEQVYDFNTDTFNIVINERTGFAKLVNPQKAWSVVLNETANVVGLDLPNESLKARDVILDQLKDASTRHGFLNDLVQKLKSDTMPEKTKVQFYSAILKTKTNYVESLYKGYFKNAEQNNVDFRFISSDTQSMKNSIITQWGTVFNNNFIKDDAVNLPAELIERIDKFTSFRTDFLGNKSTKVGNVFLKDVLNKPEEYAGVHKAVIKKINNNMIGLLQDIGITVSPETIRDFVNKQGRKEDTLLKKYKDATNKISLLTSYLSGMDGVSETAYKLSDIENESLVKELAEIDTQYAQLATEDMARGADKKSYYAFTEYTYLSHLVAAIKGHTTDIRNKKSKVLNHMTDPMVDIWASKSKFMSFLNESDFNLSRFTDSTEINDRKDTQIDPTQDSGKTSVDLTTPDETLNRMNTVLKGAVSEASVTAYPTITMADKPRYIKMTGLPFSKFLYKGDKTYTQAARDMIIHYISAEADRAVKFAGIREGLTKNRPEDTEEQKKSREFYREEVANGTFRNLDSIVIFPELARGSEWANRIGIYDVDGNVKPNIEGLWNKKELNAFAELAINTLVKDQISDLMDQKLIEKTKKGDSLFIGLDNSVKNEYASRYKTDLVRAAVTDYALNSWRANVEFTMMFNGDPAFYKDLSKRSIAVIAPGQSPVISEGIPNKYKLAILNDYVDKIGDKDSESYANSMFKEYSDAYKKDFYGDKKYTDKEIEAVLASYKEMSIADAQGYMTLKRARDIFRSFGQWEMEGEMEIEYQKAVSGKPYDSSVFKGINSQLQSLKGVAFERVSNEAYPGITIPVYVKYSAAILHPALLLSGSKLEGLYKQMIDNNIDEAVFDSGVKSGVHNANDIDSVLADGTALKTITMNSTSWRKQQDLSAKSQKSEPVLATQVKMNIKQDNRLDEEYSDGRKGREVVKDMEDSEIAMVAIGRDELNDTFDVVDGVINDDSRLRDLIYDDTVEKNPRVNILNPLKQGAPLTSIIAIREKLSSQITSMFDKYTIKQSMPGGAMIQLSNFGFNIPDVKIADRTTVGNVVRWFSDSDTLRGPRMNEDGTVESAEVLLPYHMVEAIPDWQNKTDAELKSILLNVLDGNVGYRIPNQGMSSITALKIAGILPKGSGDTVVVYNEITAQTGSDFDIDKMFVMIPHSRFNKDTNKMEKIKLSKGTDSKSVEKRYNKYARGKAKRLYSKDLFNHINEVINERKEVLEEIQNNKRIRDHYRELVELSKEDDKKLYDDYINENKLLVNELYDTLSEMESVSSVYDDWILKGIEEGKIEGIEEFSNRPVMLQNDIKAIQNHLIELYVVVLKSKVNFDKAVAPIDSEWLKDDAYRLSYLIEKSNDVAEGLVTSSEILNTPIKEISAYFAAKDKRFGGWFSARTQQALKSRNIAGKMGVAITADTLKHHVVAQLAELSMTLPEVNGNSNVLNLHKILTDDNRYISQIITAYFNAYVDNAKDPYIAMINNNAETSGVVFLLLRAGYTPEKVNRFMSQPSIRKYVEYIQNRSPFVKEKSVKGRKTIEVIDNKLALITEEGRPNAVSKVMLDYGITSLDVDYHKVFDNITEKQLEENIVTNDRETQKALFTAFIAYLDAGRELGALQGISKADVNGSGKGFADNVATRFTRDRIESEGRFINFDRMFERDGELTALGMYTQESLDLTPKLAANIAPVFTPAGTHIVEKIHVMAGLNYTEDTVNKIDNAMFAQMASGFPMFSFTREDIDNMINSENNMGKRLTDLKLRLEGKNILIDTLTSNGPFVAIKSSVYKDADNANLLIQSWEESLMTSDKEVREFAEDLVKFSFINSGFSKHMNAIFDLIPSSYYMNNSSVANFGEFMQNKMSELNSPDYFNNDFMDTFFRSNTDDRALVPRGKFIISKDNSVVGTVISLKEDFIVKGRNGNIAMYVMDKVSNVLLKYSGSIYKGESLYEVVENLTPESSTKKIIYYGINDNTTPVGEVIAPSKPSLFIGSTAEINKVEGFEDVKVSLEEVEVRGTINYVVKMGMEGHEKRVTLPMETSELAEEKAVEMINKIGVTEELLKMIC